MNFGPACPSCASMDETTCWHTDNQWALAAAFAQWAYRAEPSTEEIGVFLEDAESVEDFVGSAPWTVTDLPITQPARGDAPMSRAMLLTSPTGRHVLAVDGERLADQCVVPARYICSLPDFGAAS